MTERRLYELINPSDAITFWATPLEAAFIADRMRAGMYFVQDCETGSAPEVGDKEQFIAAYNAVWRDAGKLASYAQAYASFLCCGPSDRRLFDAAVSKMSAEDAKAHRVAWQNEKRTSLNDIVAQCWQTAEKIAAYQPEAAA